MIFNWNNFEVTQASAMWAPVALALLWSRRLKGIQLFRYLDAVDNVS